MKLLSFLTLTALLSITSCSHHMKDCCKKAAAEKVSCEKPECKDETKKSCCTDDHCKKKS